MPKVEFTCDGCGTSAYKDRWRMTENTQSYKRIFCTKQCYLSSPRSEEQKQKQGDFFRKMWATMDMTERNKKVSLSNMGRLGKKGKDNNRWKGGITKPDKLERARFRNSMQMKIFQRDNYTCQVCDEYGGKIQVDHIKGWSDYPELRFEESNCRTLCMACHYYVTFKKRLPEGVIWGHNLSRRIES